jgi:O-antigen ligase
VADAYPMTLPRLLQPVSTPVRRALLLFVVGAGFVVSPEPVWSMLFYLLVIPVQFRALAGAVRDGTVWRDMTPALAVAITMILWFVLGLAWDRSAAGHPGVQGLWVWNGFCTLLFVWGCHEAFTRSAAWRDRLITVMIVCGTLNAWIAMLRLPFLHSVLDQDSLRMPGWAETRHPILGAVIIGVPVLLTASRLLQRRAVWANAFALASCLGFIALTGSRGPILAIGGALTLLLAMARPRLLAIAVAAALVVLCLVAFLTPSVLAAVWHGFTDRGSSDRLLIWRLSLHAIGTSPWVGLGPTARMDRVNEGFPHNLFLSTLFYAGAVGLVMLLTLLALVGRIAWHRPPGVDRSMRIALLVYPMLAGMTDLSILIKGPAPMWYMVWLPLIICMGTDDPSDGAELCRAGAASGIGAPVPASGSPV